MVAINGELRLMYPTVAFAMKRWRADDNQQYTIDYMSTAVSSDDTPLHELYSTTKVYQKSILFSVRNSPWIKFQASTAKKTPHIHTPFSLFTTPR